MWIQRDEEKNKFIQTVKELDRQVLVLRGARQVGKTSFILEALKELKDFPQIYLNLASARESRVKGQRHFGRDYFGPSEDASQLLHHLSHSFGDLSARQTPVILFVDEADRHPVALEAIQALAEWSDHLKVIYTGSNLENIPLQNAATGRKCYFDLFPISFQTFLRAYGKVEAFHYLQAISLKQNTFSNYYHHQLNELFALYLRLGGMPRVLDTFLSGNSAHLPRVMVDLVESIEENIKNVLGEKSRFYEYEDVLRRLALLSLDTLKFSRLQVQHAGRGEAKKLVNKTVGARVAHKIRLYEKGRDLAKYILFDGGVLNYLLNGANLLEQKISPQHLAIQYEAVVGQEIVTQLATRDDLLYWKSPRGAQVEYLLQSPRVMALDVKTSRGDFKSLNSCALFLKGLELIIKISQEPLRYQPNYQAKLAALPQSRQIAQLTLPHYLSARLQDLCRDL